MMKKSIREATASSPSWLAAKRRATITGSHSHCDRAREPPDVKTGGSRGNPGKEEGEAAR